MSEHVVVIGAVALGPKAAARFKRLSPNAKVTMIDRSEVISYGGCGIPYFVSGDVSDASALQSTSFHMLRDEEFFRQTKGRGRADRSHGPKHRPAGASGALRDEKTGRDSTLRYDKLVLATGAAPRRLGVPGEEPGGGVLRGESV